jgi:hypothetical protein
MAELHKLDYETPNLEPQPRIPVAWRVYLLFSSVVSAVAAIVCLMAVAAMRLPMGWGAVALYVLAAIFICIAARVIRITFQ